MEACAGTAAVGGQAEWTGECGGGEHSTVGTWGRGGEGEWGGRTPGTNLQSLEG